MPRRPKTLSPTAAGRPASKLDQVIERLRTAIVSGEYPPGHRLKSYDELSPMLNVSRATLRQAISVLKDDGFIESVERSSMFVSKKPPHLTRYGLVFQEAAIETRFRRALSHVAEQLRQSGTDIVVYHGVYPGSTHPDWPRFAGDIRSHRLAGIIILSGSEHLSGTGALEDRNLPKIAITQDPQPGFAQITLDHQVFTDRGVDWLVTQGRRKLAMIGAGGTPVPECFMQSCRSRGLEFRPEWCVTLGFDYPPGAKNIAMLLGSQPAANRPDGLMILDDNFVEHASAGLVTAGVRVPDEIAVVVQCCWPWPVPNVLPLMQIGFDADEILKSAIQSIQAMRAHQPAKNTTISARMQNEIRPPAPML